MRKAKLFWYFIGLIVTIIATSFFTFANYQSINLYHNNNQKVSCNVGDEISFQETLSGYKFYGYSISDSSGKELVNYYFVNHQFDNNGLPTSFQYVFNSIGTYKVHYAVYQFKWISKYFTGSYNGYRYCWSPTGTPYEGYVSVEVKCNHSKVSDYREDIPATCTENGVASSMCYTCGETFYKTIPKLSHAYKATVTKATFSANGKTETKCDICGDVSNTTTIYCPKTIKLSKTAYTYTGKAIKPTVTVKDSNGKTISSSNYTVSYKNNTKVGKATVTVTFKGNYTGRKTLTFKINPKATSITDTVIIENSITVRWKKQASQTSGYQIQYSESKSFSSYNTVTVKSNSTTSKKINNLYDDQKYYLRIRTYRTVDGVKYYSSWSEKVTAKTKRATEIWFDSDTETIKAGKKKTLDINTYPNNMKVSWSSNNTSVAKVSSKGVVTAIKKGKATITASFKYKGKTYKTKCAVTVKK